MLNSEFQEFQYPHREISYQDEGSSTKMHSLKRESGRKSANDGGGMEKKGNKPPFKGLRYMCNSKFYIQVAVRM